MGDSLTNRPRTKKKTKAKKVVPSPNDIFDPIYGRGGYWQNISSGLNKVYSGIKSVTPKGTFQKLGTGIGTAFGHPLLGGATGNLVSKILGFGDYHVQSNSLMAPLHMGQPVPQFGDMGNCMIVSHREFVTDVTSPGTANFTNTSYPINPGLLTSFPWLSPIANQFDSYEVLGMIYEFKSTSSDYATGTALGSIILATEYDSADPAYASKVEMENSQYCISTKPSLDAIHPIECDPRVNITPRLFTRNAAPPTGKDQRLYDHGIFQIATVGNAAALGTVMGELWVSYQVAFFKPQIGGSGAMVDHFTNAVGVATTGYFGTGSENLVAKSGSTIGGTISGSVYTFPAHLRDGYYSVVYSAYGGVATLTTNLAITLVNCTAKSMLVNDGSSTLVTPEAGSLANSTAMIQRTFQINAIGSASFSISAGTLPAGTVTMDLWVTRLPVGLIT